MAHNLIPLDQERSLRKIVGNRIISEQLFRCMSRMIDKELAYIQCKRSYLDNDDIGRYIRFNGKPIVFFCVPDHSISVSEMIDTIIHESLHFAGESQILNRTNTSPIDRSSLLYIVEEYIVINATIKICDILEVNKLNPPPTVGKLSLSKIIPALRSISEETNNMIIDHIDASVDHFITGKHTRLTNISDFL